ncbi:ATP-dependent helicase HrpB [Sandarakinorhabdus sp.]|uniref:ATP-dependent helicase HrpB n=1 Tax=Sandarakinorhabdus sp. TaxID=1916663 RepID=UPI00286E00D8|nr:ATP-dependent helicase HrpB [Sandarakinorhabdus sp.]
MLPVLAVLPQLQAALAANAPVALVAPPGAGKTTAVPPALLSEPWAQSGKLILLSPRRLAARAAAERMAEQMGEAVGQTIGYRTRLDARTSAATRIIVVTEGIFTRMLVSDPELGGVAGVLFDEVHERSLDSDFALALTLEARAALRPDLRLVLMSATLDVAGFAAIIPGLVQVESAGRMFPVDLRHIGRNQAERLEDAMASAIRGALASESGSILAFLPGVAEIERTAERLETRLPADTDLFRLHGAREAGDQRAAIAPPPPGRRKIVLATSIAETSITIDGVRVVVDSGLSRRPQLDRSVGLQRLVTVRSSQAAVTQRAGRAGRTAPGVAIRLWEAAETLGRAPFDPPEIMEADLAGLVLDCARWGVPDPSTLPWRDPPPAVAVAEAQTRLKALAAIDPQGRVTAHGEKLAALPMAPEQAHMLVMAAARGHGLLAARIAVLMGERGLGGRSDDLEQRLTGWGRERGQRADAAAKLAQRWARAVGATETDIDIESAGEVLALGLPDRIAKRRGAAFLMANGRAVAPPPDSPLARSEWIVVADASGSAAGARLLLGAPLHGDIEKLLASRIESRVIFGFDSATTGVTAETQRRLGAITLARQPMERPDPARVRAALLDAVATNGLTVLPWGEAALALRARLGFAAAQGLDLPASDDAALLAGLADWLAPLLGRRLSDLSDAQLTEALQNRLDWNQRHRLDSFAPARFTTPAGSSHEIDYAADCGPAADMRVQTLFGLARHPMLAEGRVPLTLRLTSPAGRPIQVTKDLPGFWAGSWVDVKKDLKGRYPKHPWPDNPLEAPPTLRAKRPGQ